MTGTTAIRDITVVGASLAGLSSARALRAQGYDGRITVVGAERHLPYDRPPLSKAFLTGAATAADLALLEPEDAGLDLHWLLGTPAAALEPATHTVVLADGRRVDGDAVVLATGARARRLPGDLAGVHVLRTLDDAEALRADLTSASALVVVGAGFIGAEVASSARALGLDVTVVEALPTALAAPLGERMGAVVAGLHAAHGVHLRTGVGVARLHGHRRVEAVELADGTRVPADVVLVGIGVQPEVAWLAGSGLAVDGGVHTDATAATAAPGVVAVGDCALSYDVHARRPVRAEHWTHALHQPTAAAATLLGRPTPHTELPYFWSEQYGLQVQLAGRREGGEDLAVVHGSTEGGSFVATYSRQGRLVAVLGVGATREFGRWRRELRKAAAAELAAAMNDTYDVIVVGGGSAGCVVANRLSVDPGTRVLVLEAGRWDSRWDVFIHMPAALTHPIGSRFYDWRYTSEPEPHMGGRRVYHARGKVVGGSSSINGMIFQRGNPLDYERWAADPGMSGWDYAHALPYFKKMESCLAGADDWRGGSGPLVLERGPASNPLFGAFLDAAAQAGHARTPDVNGYRQEGFGPFDRNVHRGRRLSAARAYLHPALSRPNLEVRTRAHVTRVLLEGGRAVGVEWRRGRGAVQTAYAGEVVLAGGAINTPQLLQLSGVGDPDLLRGLGIDVVADLPGVGANLQDHLEVYLQHACSQPVSIAPGRRWWRAPGIGAQWLFLRSGLGATNHFEAGGFARSNADVDYPNLMFHFLPIAVRYDGSSPADLVRGGHGYQVHIGPMYSDARGWLKIRSRDPRVKPAMQFNYLSTEQDRREWVECVRVARDILGQPALAPYDAGEISPGPAVQTDEQILDWVRRDAETALHPSCTAKMGTDAMSVVDPATMGVHGVPGLRVVDASAMPYVTNGNIYAPVMMLAERASDLIAGRTPLAPEHVPFYRHRAVHPVPPGPRSPDTPAQEPQPA